MGMGRWTGTSSVSNMLFGGGGRLPDFTCAAACAAIIFFRSDCVGAFLMMYLL
jgi:hypothetical protein